MPRSQTITGAETVSSVEVLIDRFDYFLVDQFGVLHDGYQPYPGAIDALRRLHAADKIIVVISNSGKRAAVNRARLQALGFSSDCYTDIVTSGEVGRYRLQASIAQGKYPIDAKCFLLANNNDESVIEDLDMTRVSTVEDADVVVLAGMGEQRLSMNGYQQLLQPAIAQKIPFLCTNPDKIELTPEGPKFAVGAITDRIVQAGGRVDWIGKPYSEIYQFILNQLSEPQHDRVVCVGDSIEHDIQGGSLMGLSTVLIMSGILCNANTDELDQLCQEFQCTPDFQMAAFS